MRVGLLPGIALASLIVISWSAARSQTPVDDLAKPLDWPLLVSENVQASLRTAWKDGDLKYLVTIDDPKGRVNAYLTKYRGGNLTSFNFTFADEDGFRLYTLYIADSSLTKLAGTSSFTSAEQRPCTEKLYRSLVQSWRAAVSNPDKPSTHGFTYPGELDVPAASKR